MRTYLLAYNLEARFVNTYEMKLHTLLMNRQHHVAHCSPQRDRNTRFCSDKLKAAANHLL